MIEGMEEGHLRDEYYAGVELAYIESREITQKLLGLDLSEDKNGEIQRIIFRHILENFHLAEMNLMKCLIKTDQKSKRIYEAERQRKNKMK